MSTRIFGVSIATILLIIAVIVLTRLWGSKVPLVSSIGS